MEAIGTSTMCILLESQRTLTLTNDQRPHSAHCRFFPLTCPTLDLITCNTICIDQHSSVSLCASLLLLSLLSTSLFVLLTNTKFIITQSHGLINNNNLPHIFYVHESRYIWLLVNCSVTFWKFHYFSQADYFSV